MLKTSETYIIVVLIYAFVFKCFLIVHICVLPVTDSALVHVYVHSGHPVSNKPEKTNVTLIILFSK